MLYDGEVEVELSAAIVTEFQRRGKLLKRCGRQGFLDLILIFVWQVLFLRRFERFETGVLPLLSASVEGNVLCELMDDLADSESSDVFFGLEAKEDCEKPTARTG